MNRYEVYFRIWDESHGLTRIARNEDEAIRKATWDIVSMLYCNDEDINFDKCILVEENVK